MSEAESLVSTLQEAFAIFRRRMMGNMFVYARDKGLTMPQIGAMFHIAHSRGCSVSDIGSDLGVTNSAASQMLERMVQMKLISRSEDPTDRRGKVLVLTDQGYQVLQEGNRANRNWLEALAQSMTPDEQVLVGKAMAVLISKAHQLETVAGQAGAKHHPLFFDDSPR